MTTETALCVLITEVDGELADISLHSTRKEAGAAFLSLAQREWSEREGDKNPQPAKLADCIDFLIRECRYVDVRMIRARLNSHLLQQWRAKRRGGAS